MNKLYIVIIIFSILLLSLGGYVIFIIDADYSLFVNGGKVYIDDTSVDSKNYTSESGSTKIIFKKEYMDSLDSGNHTLKVLLGNGQAVETTFTIQKIINNPQTGDNIMIYIILFSVSIMGLAGIIIINKNKKRSKKE